MIFALSNHASPRRIPQAPAARPDGRESGTQAVRPPKWQWQRDCESASGNRPQSRSNKALRLRQISAMPPTAVAARINPRPEKPQSLTPSVSAATAIIPKPKPHASCSSSGICSLRVGNKRRNSHIPANAVNKGSRNAMTRSELESNQSGLTGFRMGRSRSIVYRNCESCQHLF